MADAKISALAAITVLADADELAVASSGASKKITGANLKSAMHPATAFVKRTAGDLSITDDGSWHDVPTIGDLTIAAATSDILMISLDGVTDNSVRFEVQFPTSGNYAGPGISSTQGIAGWANRSAGVAPVGNGAIFYTVQSGDISAGNVACRLRYTTASSGATKIFAGTAVGPLTFAVVNLRQ